jgi:receptor protein-tyrosine kinase
MNAQQINKQSKAASFDLAQLFTFLWRNKIKIVLTICVLVSLCFYKITTLPRYYKASSTILLDTNSKNLSLPDPVSTLTGSSDTQLDTYIEYMYSRVFLSDIVSTLNLTQYEEFRSKKPGVDEARHVEFAISQLLYRLSIRPLGETNLLKISFESLTPEVSVAIVDQVGPAFFQFLDNLSKKRADEASAWLTNHIAELQEELSLAEQSYQDFLRENQMIDTSSQINIANKEIAALLQQRSENHKKMAGLERTLAQIKLADGDIDQMMSIPQFLNLPMLVEVNSKLAEHAQRFAELKDRYKFKHPKYIQAQSNLQQLLSERQSTISTFIAAVKQDYESLKIVKEGLDEQIQQAMEQLSELGADELRLNRLKREVMSTQKVYDAFLERLQETEILRELGQNEHYSVVDVATLPTSPSKPNLTLLVAVSILVSSFFSAAFWLAISIINDKESRYRNVLNKIGIPVLSEVPRLSTTRFDKTLTKSIQRKETYHPFTEAIRSLRTALMVSNKEVRIVIVSGIRSGDGKSTIGVTLAKAFGQLDKTLLIDADLRNPSLHEIFNMPLSHPGLTNFVKRTDKYKDCIEKLRGSQLSIMPSGDLPNDPLVELTKNRLTVMLERMAVFYERVIVIAPSIAEYSDGLVLAKNADAAVLVCDVENNSADDVTDSVQRLQEVGTPTIGVVFNKSKSIRANRNAPSRLRLMLSYTFRFLTTGKV